MSDWKKCKRHPKYKVLRAPRAAYRTCRIIWRQANARRVRRDIESAFRGLASL